MSSAIVAKAAMAVFFCATLDCGIRRLEISDKQFAVTDRELMITGDYPPPAGHFQLPVPLHAERTPIATA